MGTIPQLREMATVVPQASHDASDASDGIGARHGGGTDSDGDKSDDDKGILCSTICDVHTVRPFPESTSGSSGSEIRYVVREAAVHVNGGDLAAALGVPGPHRAEWVRRVPGATWFRAIPSAATLHTHNIRPTRLPCTYHPVEQALRFVKHDDTPTAAALAQIISDLSEAPKSTPADARSVTGPAGLVSAMGAPAGDSIAAEQEAKRGQASSADGGGPRSDVQVDMIHVKLPAWLRAPSAKGGAERWLEVLRCYRESPSGVLYVSQVDVSDLLHLRTPRWKEWIAGAARPRVMASERSCPALGDKRRNARSPFIAVAVACQVAARSKPGREAALQKRTDCAVEWLRDYVDRHTPNEWTADTPYPLSIPQPAEPELEPLKAPVHRPRRRRSTTTDDSSARKRSKSPRADSHRSSSRKREDAAPKKSHDAASRKHEDPAPKKHKTASRQKKSRSRSSSRGPAHRKRDKRGRSKSRKGDQSSSSGERRGGSASPKEGKAERSSSSVRKRARRRDSESPHERPSKRRSSSQTRQSEKSGVVPSVGAASSSSSGAAAAGSRTMGRLLSSVACRTCDARFDTATHLPKTLSGCAHTICLRCAALIVPALDGALKCPYDNVAFGPAGVDAVSLPTNRALLEVIDAMSHILAVASSPAAP
jgi:hypothetical protein